MASPPDKDLQVGVQPHLPIVQRIFANSPGDGFVINMLLSQNPFMAAIGEVFIASIQSDGGDGGDDGGDDGDDDGDDGDGGGDDGLLGDAGWVLHTGFIPATSCQSAVAVVKKRV